MIDFNADEGYFFHYTTREAAFEHIIPDRQLRFSPYAKMRDPLEAQAPTLGAGLFVPDDPAQEEELQRSYFEAYQQIGLRRGQAKLLSLTIDAPEYAGHDQVFGRGYARARMWEQYAEHHHGVCLVFRRSRLEEVILEQLGDGPGRVLSGPVRYSKTGLQGTGAATLLPEQGVTGDRLAEMHLDRHAGSFFLLKLADWESEHEYRFVQLSTGEHYTTVEFRDSLSAVVLGQKFPAWQVYGALEMCRPLGAELMQMAWQMNRPLPHRPRLPDGSIVEADGRIRPQQNNEG